MATLYELSAEARALRDIMLDAGMGEDVIADTLEAETDIASKIQQYVYVIKDMEVFADGVAVEAKRMADRSRMAKERVTKIKTWLMQNMQHAGIQKQEFPEFTVRVQNNPQSVDVLDEKAIPSDYFNTPVVTPQLDKKRLLEALKTGSEIDGAAIKQTQSLRII